MQVPLGVLLKSEQRSEDMVDILYHIHQYIPKLKSGMYYPIFFCGDQMTRERATGAQDAKLQSDNDKSRLRGIYPEAADWHTLQTFYQVQETLFTVIILKNHKHIHIYSIYMHMHLYS